MAIGATKTWIAGEVLTASDLNAEFLNILNNGQSVGSPRTAAFDLDGQQIVLDADGDTHITADTDDQIDVAIGGTDVLVITPTSIKFNGENLTTGGDVRRLGLSSVAGRLSSLEHRVNAGSHSRVLESRVFS